MERREQLLRSQKASLKSMTIGSRRATRTGEGIEEGTEEGTEEETEEGTEEGTGNGINK